MSNLFLGDAVICCVIEGTVYSVFVCLCSNILLLRATLDQPICSRILGMVLDIDDALSILCQCRILRVGRIRHSS